MDCDADEADFITKYRSDKGSLFLSSQALSIINDHDRQSPDPSKRQYEVEPYEGSKSGSDCRMASSTGSRPSPDSLITNSMDDLENEIVGFSSSSDIKRDKETNHGFSTDDEISNSLSNLFYLSEQPQYSLGSPTSRQGKKMRFQLFFPIQILFNCLFKSFNSLSHLRSFYDASLSVPYLIPFSSLLPCSSFPIPFTSLMTHT